MQNPCFIPTSSFIPLAYSSYIDNQDFLDKALDQDVHRDEACRLEAKFYLYITFSDSGEVQAGQVSERRPNLDPAKFRKDPI